MNLIKYQKNRQNLFTKVKYYGELLNEVLSEEECNECYECWSQKFGYKLCFD